MSLNLVKFHGYRSSTFTREADSLELDSVDLVEEVPLSLSINDIAYAVIMITPVNVEEFALGYALSEDIIQHRQDVRDIDIQSHTSSLNIESIQVNLIISSRRFSEFKSKRKIHLGASGCGLCGIESLDQALPALMPLGPSKCLSPERLFTLRNRLNQAQQLGQKTGALHAALLLSEQGDTLACMEDIGRHNCLDKIIGYAAQQGIKLHNHNVVMSSRCSTELIQKAVRAGLSNLIHLASPSHLAVKLANQYGLTLIHLSKQNAPRFFAPTARKDNQDDQ
ncbi:formate dehydrogenase accessory sulfurtransferase FdhD [Marinomonas sp. TW1]|uniref:formate dehydrogenase accessory sulfurtransferase FdhD n=1 Tax=Marinomonas sp. TW1 TaxID=1561203 RepID=UPI0007AF41BC|nr:formate dehydrogenase accessory sulfurtransferase FdhD [Marinomonas sp. TW1]KZN14649.1 formate dehydrogenase [Marinomonas sp. TW1]